MDVVVLDLNGVLVRREPQSGKGPSSHVKPLMTIARTRVYLRPHAIEFLEWVMGRFNVAIWTSARKDTALAIVRALKLAGAPMDRLTFLWCQDRCDIERLPGVLKPNIRKDLSRIPAAFSIVERVAIVDDTQEKVFGCSNNLRLVTPLGDDALALGGALCLQLDAFLRKRTDKKFVKSVNNVTSTADGRIAFDTIVNGRTMHAWAAMAHCAMAKVYGWSPNLPQLNTFGWNNLVSSADALLRFVSTNVKKHHPLTVDEAVVEAVVEAVDEAVDEAAAAVHDGWVTNYVFWREHTPFVNDPWMYARPRYPLGDERRNACALASFAELPDDEKDKDRVVARALLDALRG